MVKHQKRGLKKDLGLLEATLYGIGVILGAGIYAIIGEGAGIAGNMVWLSFVIAAIIASFTGLSYAELSSMYPKSAAEYHYTKNAFRKTSLSFIIAIVMILAGVIGAAAVSLAFAGYFSVLFGTPILWTAVALIAILGLINYRGIKFSARFNSISAIIEAGGLILITIFGLSFLGLGNVNYFDFSLGFSGILAAVSLIFFAYLGFEEIVNVSEETKNSRKVIPKALIISMIVSTVLYILVSLVSVSVIGADALANSNAPLTDVFVAEVGSEGAIVLSIIALFATFNTALIMLIVASRILYSISREGCFPKKLTRIGKYHTPHVAILIVTILAVLFLFSGGLKTVAGLTNISVFIAYFFVNVSLLKLRYSKPNMKRGFKVPINIGRFPVLAFLGAATSGLMLVFFDHVIVLGELAIIIIGYLLYRIFAKNKCKL